MVLLSAVGYVLMMNDPKSPSPRTAEHDPICFLCGEVKSKHTKQAADWRTVAGCIGAYLPAAKGDPVTIDPAVSPKDDLALAPRTVTRYRFIDDTLVDEDGTDAGCVFERGGEFAAFEEVATLLMALAELESIEKLSDAQGEVVFTPRQMDAIQANLVPKTALATASEELRMGHVRVDECTGAEATKGQPLYERITWLLQRAENRRAEIAERLAEHRCCGVETVAKMQTELETQRTLLAQQDEAIARLTTEENSDDPKTQIAARRRALHLLKAANWADGIAAIHLLIEQIAALTARAEAAEAERGRLTHELNQVVIELREAASSAGEYTSPLALADTIDDIANEFASRVGAQLVAESAVDPAVGAQHSPSTRENCIYCNDLQIKRSAAEATVARLTAALGAKD